jgi:hypothetical protein
MILSPPIFNVMKELKKYANFSQLKKNTKKSLSLKAMKIKKKPKIIFIIILVLHSQKFLVPFKLEKLPIMY